MKFTSQNLPRLDLNDFKLHQKVYHLNDGPGEVIIVDDDRVKVGWDDGSNYSFWKSEPKRYSEGFVSKANYFIYVAAEKLRSQLPAIHHAARVNGTLVAPSSPNGSDIELVKIWAQGESSENKEATLTRMLSARLAEKAVAEYFESNNYTVDDIAASQINEDNNGDWKLYDLRVQPSKPRGGILYVDVKNSRRSELNPKSYTRHCVPNFKFTSDYRSTRKRQEVQIAGALSSYVHYKKITAEPGEVLYLGLTSQKVIDGMIRHFSGDGLIIDFALCGQRMLPPWTFEHQPEVYQLRQRLIQCIALEQASIDESAPDEYKILQLAKSIRPLGFSRYSYERVLAEGIQTLGLSLPVIYLSVLKHFINSLQQERDYNARAIESLIYTGAASNDKLTPMFVYDPLETVGALLACLSKLWKNKTEELKRFKSFRLIGLNSLRGARDGEDSSWQTLVTYCGGWTTTAAGKLKPCGNTPLVWGECCTCDCGYLICPECEFCCKTCKSL
ncbi:hypothetical protein [Persicirhabdus sediminis]|uniref:Uncharacterized protein n=1 Tax=Persicirhabdus sediminis TaxID=454144 RepID=A0A8J7MG22_9BACT|nr:hypothetical protein [Persicirhabdus sediminis]MBK1792136.1 hypothetical protein [Persicirhabdus sediminis]